MFKNLSKIKSLSRRFGSHKDWANHELPMSQEPIIKLNLENKYAHILGIHTKINNDHELVSSDTNPEYDYHPVKFGPEETMEKDMTIP